MLHPLENVVNHSSHLFPLPLLLHEVLLMAQPQLFPRIFGHEASGVVESVSHEVTEFEEGVTLFTGECMSCRHCASGKSNICQVLGLERQGLMHSDKKHASQ